MYIYIYIYIYIYSIIFSIGLRSIDVLHSLKVCYVAWTCIVEKTRLLREAAI